MGRTRRGLTTRRFGRRTLAAAGLVLAGLLAATLLLAPQIFTLAREGFPGATWPARGSFAPVAGGVADDPPAGAPLPADAARRFAESGGRALLVDRGGRLTEESYGPEAGRETRLNSYSMVKGLVGALTLRAIADGRIGGLDTKLAELLGPDAPAISVGEALTMTGGLYLSGEPEKPMEDGGFAPWSGLARLHAYGVDAVMPRLRPDPAKRGQFSYASVNTALLGRAVERAYGRPLPEILSDLIWTPAGAAEAHWRRYPGGGEVSAYCCLYARPLDWLKVGRFLMENGTAGAPFLPEPMWRDFLMPQLPDAQRRAGIYGQHIRHDVLDRAGEAMQGPFAYFMGHGGQVLWFLPDADAVVVRFGDEAQLLHSTIYELFP